MLASLAYTEMGQMENAMAAISKAVQLENSDTGQILMVHVNAAKGNRTKAEQLLKDIAAKRKHRYLCAYEVAHAYIKMGDKKKAYEWLDRGLKERADCMIWLWWNPGWTRFEATSAIET